MVYAMFICLMSGLLFIISMTRMMSVKKWMKLQIKLLEEKKKELDDIIYSASDMVHELNNVSDYVANVIEEKNTALNSTLKTVEEKLIECKNMFEQSGKNKVINFPSEGISHMLVHSRKMEIEKLYIDGYSVSDIAKELSVGKGEIELILGITERYLKLAN